MATAAKITAFLEVAPMTYEELRRLSSIHRNNLRTRINELTDKRIIIKHKFRFPKNGSRSEPSKVNKLIHLPQYRDYYLLNLFNNEAIGLFKNYYDMRNVIITRIKRVRKLKDEIKEAKGRMKLTDKLGTLYLSLMSLKRPSNYEMTKWSKEITDKRIGESDQIGEYISQYDQKRQISILNVSGIRRVGSDTSKMDKVNEENLSEFMAFVIHHGYSILDLLIRICHYPTIFETVNDVVPRTLFIPIFDYFEIFHFLKDSRYKKEMFRAFRPEPS